MFNTDFNIKEYTREVLTEDFVKENNKIFNLSDQSYEDFKVVKKYISSFQQKNLEDISFIFSEDVVLITNGQKFVEQKNVIEHLKSIIDNFNPNELPIKSRDSFISVSMELGEIKKDCHNDAEGCLFVIPWEHFFSCRIILEYYNIENKLDINHSIKFDDNGKICEIILH
jgi:hypothetical protein